MFSIIIPLNVELSEMNKMFLTFNMYSNIFYFRLGPKIKSRGATTSQS